MLKTSDIVLVKGRKPTKLQKLLKILYWGVERVKLSGYECALAETEDGGVQLVAMLQGDNIVGLPDVSFKYLAEQADNLDDTYLDKLMAVTAASITLTEIHRKQR